MSYDPEKHDRRSIRLPGYDYSSPGAYFVTICTHKHQCLFTEIRDGEIHSNALGHLVKAQWENLPQHYPHVELDVFVIMPNHIHGIVILRDHTTVGAAQHTLPEIICEFKTCSARRVNHQRNTPGSPIWHRSFFDYIIYDEQEVLAIREYILNNPVRWLTDRDHPENYRSED